MSYKASNLVSACVTGDFREVCRIIDEEIEDPGANDNEVICVAVKGGFREIVFRLLADTRVKPISRAINEARSRGEFDILQALHNRKRDDIKKGIFY
jgi:hypothetical protein